MSALNEALRSIRNRLGETTTQFGQRLGCHQATISKYERGQIAPSRSMLLLVLRWAEGEEREVVLDALGVDRELQEGWDPGELARELEGFEDYLDAGGRKEFKTKTPRRDFIRLAKLIAGDTENQVPVWLIELLQQFVDHRNDRDAIESFEHIPIYLDVQLKTLQAQRAAAALIKPRASRRSKE